LRQRQPAMSSPLAPDSQRSGVAANAARRSRRRRPCCDIIEKAFQQRVELSRSLQEWRMNRFLDHMAAPIPEIGVVETGKVFETGEGFVLAIDHSKRSPAMLDHVF